jgi:hypothetical protein
MKKLFSIAAVLAIATSVFASEISVDTTKEIIGKDSFILKQFEKDNVKINKANVISDMIIVNATQSRDVPGPNGAVVKQDIPVKFFVSRASGNVIFGPVVDSKTGQELAVPVDMNKYTKSAAFTVGTGKKEIYVLTDPDCPACTGFEKNWDEIVKKGYQIHVYFYPLDNLHPNARAKAEYVMSKPEKDRYATLKSIQGLDSKNMTWKDAKIKNIAEIKKQMKAYQDMGADLELRGTPTIVDKNGIPTRNFE